MQEVIQFSGFSVWFFVFYWSFCGAIVLLLTQRPDISITRKALWWIGTLVTFVVCDIAGEIMFSAVITRMPSPRLTSSTEFTIACMFAFLWVLVIVGALIYTCWKTRLLPPRANMPSLEEMSLHHDKLKKYKLLRRNKSEPDPLEEAELYLAFGRKYEAVEVLKEALAKTPGRVDISVKLSEIDAVACNKV